MPKTKSTLYWQFDDRNPAFIYGPGWSNSTDSNAHNSTLSYSSEKTSVAVRFYGKAMWLFGVIGKTENQDQPVYRFTLDNQFVSTAVADIRDEPAYNQLLVSLHDLNLSNHTLVVENINEGATLFLDYYLVEPVPSTESTKTVGGYQIGGEPLTTSISEHPMLTMTSGTGKTAVGTIAGAVLGGVFGLLLITISVVALWRRRRGSKPYFYKSAAAYDVLADEFESDKHEPTQDPPASPASLHPSSIYSLGSNRSSNSLLFPKAYFPLPSEYQSQKLLAKSNSIRSQSSTHSSSSSPDPSLSQEQRPLL